MRQIGLHWKCLTACGALAAALLAAAEIQPLPTAPAPKPGFGAQLHHLSPVEYFRGLLSMTPAERERALASRSPSDRAAILAKVREYEALPLSIREARLCQTELHWELSQLMRMAPAARSNHLKEVSVLYRPMVEGFLREWDQVSLDSQKMLLEKQSFLETFLRMQGSPAAVQQQVLNTLPPERRIHWAEDMARWQALPEEQRADLCAEFKHFCSLSGSEQQATVKTLSETERREMERALEEFDSLPPEERARCIDSFRKFATLEPEERIQFLQNAARWDAMTGHERQLWREMVHQLPPAPPGFPKNMPPMPPGFYSHMPPMPPNVTAPVIVARATNDLR